MERSSRSGRVGAAIVRRKHEDRVVELAEAVQERDETADILVGAVEHRRIGFHVTEEQVLPVRRHLIPGRYQRIAIRQACPGWNYSHPNLTLKTRGTDGVPAGIVTAAIFL